MDTVLNRRSLEFINIVYLKESLNHWDFLGHKKHLGSILGMLDRQGRVLMEEAKMPLNLKGGVHCGLQENPKWSWETKWFYFRPVILNLEVTGFAMRMVL